MLFTVTAFLSRWYRSCVNRMLVSSMYRTHVQPVSSLSAQARAEVELLLASAHGPHLDAARVFEETDEICTVAYQNMLVACVFTKAVAWASATKSAEAGAEAPGAPSEVDRHRLAFCNVRALSVAPEHRRIGIASRLLRFVKKKAHQDGMLWIELHVDEKRDKSHQHLLKLYRQHNFMVLPRPASNEYLLICVNYH